MKNFTEYLLCVKVALAVPRMQEQGEKGVGQHSGSGSQQGNENNV